MTTSQEQAADLAEPLAPPSGPGPRRRRPVATVGLVLLVASAVVGSNLFGLRDSIFGSATPAPTTAAASRVAGPGAATATTGVAEPTRLRSQPWWQGVTTLEGSGAATVKPFTIDKSAIQWRVKSTCESGRLLVRVAQRQTPLVDAACPAGATGEAGKTGLVNMTVTADGPWKLQVEQQVDVPLMEPPLATMTAPGATVVTKATFYPIDKSVTGTATIYRQADGSHALRLEDFFVTPSPELQLRLSPLLEPKNSDEAASPGWVQAARLDVTTGSLNFVIPDTIDLTKYKSLIIWCSPVSSAYAAASLGSIR